MPKRFLNVEYAGTPTRINVTEFEDLSEVQDAIKTKYGPVMNNVGAPQLRLYDQEDKYINTWPSFESLPQEYFVEGGPFLTIGISPPPPAPRQSGTDGLLDVGSSSSMISSEDGSRKRQRIDDLANQQNAQSQGEADKIRPESFFNADTWRTFVSRNPSIELSGIV